MMQEPQHGTAGRRPTSDAVLAALYLLVGPFVVLSQRYLSLTCDSYVIGHYRSLVGSVAILLVAVAADRAGLLRVLRHRHSMLLTGLSGILLAASSLFFLEGMRRTSALAAALVAILTMPLMTGISLWIFHDERPRRPRRLAAGMALATLGAVGYAWTGPRGEAGGVHTRGMILLASAVVCSGATVLLGKHLVRRGGAFSLGGLTQAVAAVVLLVAALARGVYQTPAQLGPATLLWLTASGAVGMLVGAGLGMMLLERIGILRRQMVDIWTPPLVGLFAWLLFRERIQGAQLVCMLTLLAGCVLVLTAGRRSEATVLSGEPGAKGDRRHDGASRQSLPAELTVMDPIEEGATA